MNKDITSKTFKNEKEFQKNFIELLCQNGWTNNRFEKLEYVNENDLIQNWKNIIFANNKDRLNNIELTNSEMDKIISQISAINSPGSTRELFHSGEIIIKRDNELDESNYKSNKDVYLKIFNKSDVGAGNSIYQVASEITLNNASNQTKRADVMLLINGIPTIHIELKDMGRSVEESINQINEYNKIGCYTGIFNMIQLFVGLTPTRMMYAPRTKKYKDSNNKQKSFKEIDKSLFSIWADENNNKEVFLSDGGIKTWVNVVSKFLNIPTAHELVSWFILGAGDSKKEDLWMLRSYQYHAIQAIYNKLIPNKNLDWTNNKIKKGGYVWHTTGSGKTLTTFKAAQKILDNNLADLVIISVDRIDLENQTEAEFKKFATLNTKEDNIQEIKVFRPKDTNEIYEQLIKTNKSSKTIVVTTIHKLSKVDNTRFTNKEIERFNSKRIVIISDEAHRSNYSSMGQKVSEIFSNAVLFGLTGTPLKIKDQKGHGLLTTDVFGEELHKYTISDGINDGNVLRFCCKFVIFKERYSLYAINHNVNEHSEINISYQKQDNNLDDNISRIQLLDIQDQYEKEIKTKKLDDLKEQWNLIKRIDDGKYVQKNLASYIKIEEELKSQNYFEDENYKKEVVSHIYDNWNIYSVKKKFSAILATSSSQDALSYYQLFKEYNQLSNLKLNVSVLFDPNEDSAKSDQWKHESIKNIINDYNKQYNLSISGDDAYNLFRKDLSNRLAKKQEYEQLSIKEQNKEQLDLLIVVEQMLTGYDSRWVNTIYLDKVLYYDNLIQAMSRTNRIFDEDKTQANIVFYRYPISMQKNIDEALRVYADCSYEDVRSLNLEECLAQIKENVTILKRIFSSWGFDDFSAIKTIQKNKLTQEEINDYYNEVNDAYSSIIAIDKIIKKAWVVDFDWQKNQQDINLSLDEFKNIIPGRLKDLHDVLLFNKETKQKIDSSYYNHLFVNYGEKSSAIEYLKEINSDFFKNIVIISNNQRNDLTKSKQYQQAIVEINKILNRFSESERKYHKKIIDKILNFEISISNEQDYELALKHERDSERDGVFNIIKSICFDDKIHYVDPLLKEMVTSDDIHKNNNFNTLMDDYIDINGARKYIANNEGSQPKNIKRIKVENFLEDAILKIKQNY